MTDELIKQLFASKPELPWLERGTIFIAKHGSVAYGLNTPESDLDVKGVTIPPKEYFLGFTKVFEQAEFKIPVDGSIYELRKFMKLAADCNPGMFEILWSSDEDHLFLTPVGRKLIENRDLFLSKKVKYTFCGYAYSQLHRINLHYRWLKNPPKAPPTRTELGLPPETLIPQDQLGAAEAEIKKKMESWDINWDLLERSDRINMQDRIARMLSELKITSDDDKFFATAKTIGYDTNFIEALRRERAYKARKQEWDNYQTWVKTRNPKRAELERKFGYDTKFALSLIRLLRMAREILVEGKVKVKRTEDREELMDIRYKGIWSYETLIEWADKQEKELTEIYPTSNLLPRSSDIKKLDHLCQELIEKSWNQP